MNTHEAKLLEAVRLMQKSVNNLEAVIVEQIGNHAVVTAETKEPKQFDPNTADKRKPFRAIHKSGATGNVYYAWFCERWLFTNYDNVQSYAEDCTHIDYNPIDYSDIAEYKHID